MTNREFSESNPEFKAACGNVQIPATKRQASKWRRRLGKAWKEWQKRNTC